MKTPIYDFVKDYKQKNRVRFHMPGHKGRGFLGCEALDITEIPGADSLYEAKGIIRESEQNASLLFGSAKTFYSTEGSSQCIKAMLYLLLCYGKKREGKRPYIIAARNAHKAFLQGAALLDLDVVWWQQKERESLCSCKIIPKDLEKLMEERQDSPIGVYITSPDYLGNLLPIKEIAEICHRYDTYLAVDNAHGSYLHFLEEPIHPLDQGADICCDSAHKTLPVLTGGAYLHIGNSKVPDWQEHGKQALALFGSTSPSYLILSSLDRCNWYLWQEYKMELLETLKEIDELKKLLMGQGWSVENTEPLKLTFFLKDSYRGEKRDGIWLAKEMEKSGIYLEYADPEYAVFMFTPKNTVKEFTKLKEILLEIKKEKEFWEKEKKETFWSTPQRKQRMSLRKAMMAQRKIIPVEKSIGKICAEPIISCPPAIPILVSGEEIRQEDIQIFQYYGIESVSVVKEE